MSSPFDAAEGSGSAADALHAAAAVFGPLSPALTPPSVAAGVSEEGQRQLRRSLAIDTEGPLNAFAEVMSYTLLFLLIFGMSATVDMDRLLLQLRNKFAISTGVGMQFVIMPFLGYLSVLALRDHGLSPSMGLTLLIVTSSPGGSYSNWWCSMFNADLALSVAMTALSTLLSTFLLPANLMLYSHAAFGSDDILNSIDWGALFISLGVVIAAILSGLFASYKVRSHRFNRWANRFGTFSGILLVIFSAVLSSGDSETSLWGQDWSFYVGVSFPCLLGLFLSNLFSRLARLSKPECVTIGVECCYQNVGIATSAAVAMFDDPKERAEAMCVPLFYGLMEAIVLGIYCLLAWKAGWTKAPRDEKICVVLAKTYEVEDDDDSDAEEEEEEEDREEGKKKGAALADGVGDIEVVHEDAGAPASRARGGVDGAGDAYWPDSPTEEAPLRDFQESPSPPDRNGGGGFLGWLFRPFQRRRRNQAAVEELEDAFGDYDCSTPGRRRSKRGEDACCGPSNPRNRVVSEDYTTTTSATGDTEMTPASDRTDGSARERLESDEGADISGMTLPATPLADDRSKPTGTDLRGAPDAAAERRRLTGSDGGGGLRDFIPAAYCCAGDEADVVASDDDDELAIGRARSWSLGTGDMAEAPVEI